jgi:hypothetical protein
MAEKLINPLLKVVNKQSNMINPYMIAPDNVIKVTCTPTAGFGVGITVFFASGTITIDWKDGSAPQNFTHAVEIIHTYVNAGTYIAEISGDLANIIRFVADTCRITNLYFPPITINLTYLQLENNLLAGILNLQSVKISSNVLNLYNNPYLQSILFDNSSAPIALTRLYQCGFVGTLDLSKLKIKGTVQIHTNPYMTNIAFGTGNEKVTNMEIRNNQSLSGTVDFSNVSVGSYFYCRVCPNVTGIVFASSGNSILTNCEMHSCNYSSIDLSNVPIGGASSQLYFYSNSNLVSIIFASSGNSTLKDFRAYSCNLDYINLASGGFNLNSNSCNIQIQNNSMIAADVNHILVDLYSLVSGEGAGGSYTGRVINIGGTNSDPNNSSGGYDGLAAKAALEGKGFTVTIT